MRVVTGSRSWRPVANRRVVRGDRSPSLSRRAVYSTCLFCNQALGTNSALESFPVGRRVAFDAAKGRLWVVCRRCERWNLTPLDERWEAVEEAERFYRDTRRRVATDEIGLARLRDGTLISPPARKGSPTADRPVKITVPFGPRAPVT